MIARDVLTLLMNGEFSIGTVAALDEFLTENPLPEATGEEGWQNYLTHCRKMVDAVIRGWLGGDTEYQPRGMVFLEVSAETTVTIRQSLDLYDDLLTNQLDAPLLAQLASPQGTLRAIDGRIKAEFARRLGHSNPEFPLADHQRQVLAWLDAAEDGEVIAVNGPPVTGKTTMLLSAVAGLWVRAAPKGGDTPYYRRCIVEQSGRHKYYRCLRKELRERKRTIRRRWLPDVKSSGIS